MRMRFSKRAPAQTRATRWGAFTARHLAWADSMSLNAIATRAAREPGPLVTRCPSRLDPDSLQIFLAKVRGYTPPAEDHPQVLIIALGRAPRDPRPLCRLQMIKLWPWV